MSNTKVDTNLYSFSSFNPAVFYENLKNLAYEEYWGDLKNGKPYPILVNYISHTFRRLANLYNIATTQEEKDKYIFFENDRAIIDTGLFTSQYNKIYIIFAENKNFGKINPKNGLPYQPYYCMGSFEDCSYEVMDFSSLPKRAQYFNNLDDLIYDTNLELIVQTSHILSDEENKSRIPEKYLKDEEQLKVILSGAIEIMKKRVASNYRIAVPQLYKDKIQLLLPISLSGNIEADIVLSVTKIGDKYRGSTCLTLEQAYNNARLLARPEVDWLNIKKDIN